MSPIVMLILASMMLGALLAGIAMLRVPKE